MTPALARALGWDAAREREELERFTASLQGELSFLARALDSR
jgi:hypothetical protein